MAKVKQVKAAKDHPAYGIKKGDIHYVAHIKTGPRSSRTIRQKEPIRQSQMTSSPYLQITYGAQEIMESWTLTDLDGDAVRDVWSSLAEARDQAQEAFDNMPEGLQQGETGQRLEQRVSYCDEAEQLFDDLAEHMDDRPEDPGEFEGEHDEEDDAFQDWQEKRDAYDDWETEAEVKLNECQEVELDE